MNTTLGIGFSSGSIYFTELVNDSGIPKLEHVETASVDFDFEDNFSRHKSSQKDLANISGEIQNYLLRRNLDVRKFLFQSGLHRLFNYTAD